MRCGKAMILGSAFWAAGLAVMVPAASAAVIAQYNFDALTNSDKTAADISKNGHDVTWTKAVTSDASNPFDQNNNKSVELTYNTGTAAGPGTVNLNNSGRNEFTIEGWIKPLSTGAEAKIVSMESGSARIYLRMDSAGNASARVFNGQSANDGVLTGDALVVGEWNYLAVTYTNSGWATLYVKNSTHTTLTQAAKLAIGRSMPSSLSTLAVGNTNATSLTALFDDVRISDTVLSDAELGYHQSFTPEPGSMGLLGLGGLLLLRRRGNLRI